MLKENWRLISRLERLGDFAIIVISFFFAYYGRESLIYWDEKFSWGIPFGGQDLAPISQYFVVLIVGIIGYLIMLNALGGYTSMRMTGPARLLYLSFVSSLAVFIALGAVLYLLKLDLSRSFIVIFCGLTFLLISAERFLVLELLRFWRRQGMNFRSVLIVGIGDQARRLAVEITSRPELGVRIRGFGTPNPVEESQVQKFVERLEQEGYTGQTRVVRGVGAIQQILTDLVIDEVIFTDVAESMVAAEELVLTCSEQGIRTTIVADLFGLGMVKSALSYFNGIPLIHFQAPPGDRWELGIKRLVDITVSGALLLILSPLFALIAISVATTSRGPIFFRQRRIGLNGRPFYLFKFRSMRFGAERELKELKGKNEMVGPAFKIKDDPRITSCGRFLRRFSLDELPQLWNVFIGEMSLVGPRPPVPSEVNLYERRSYLRRLSMRPGITCTWQISGRNEIKDFEDWVKLDLEYIDNWSLGLDLLLLFKTLPAVLRGTGAR